jgi:hypothetical protein
VSEQLVGQGFVLACRQRIHTDLKRLHHATVRMIEKLEFSPDCALRAFHLHLDARPSTSISLPSLSKAPSVPTNPHKVRCPASRNLSRPSFKIPRNYQKNPKKSSQLSAFSFFSSDFFSPPPLSFFLSPPPLLPSSADALEGCDALSFWFAEAGERSECSS